MSNLCKMYKYISTLVVDLGLDFVKVVTTFNRVLEEVSYCGVKGSGPIVNKNEDRGYDQNG